MTTTELLALDRLCYPEKPLSASQLNRALQKGNWVIAGDERTGAYLVAECGAGVVTVRRLGVDPERRRKGSGSVLLNAIKNKECQAVVSEMNTGGQLFLRANGFKCIGVDRDKGQWSFSRHPVTSEEKGTNTT